MPFQQDAGVRSARSKMAIFASRQRLGAAALILAASAFLSRLMGLVRDKIISWQFGTSQEADLYFAAFVVPDVINYLLAGGFMSITLIPLLADGFHKDEADTWRFFTCVLFWMFAASCLLAGIGAIWAEPLARLTAPGFSLEQTLRLTGFMRIILPGQIFFLTGACFTALLFLRRQFTAPAISPLIYNGSIILCGVALPLLPGISPDFGMTGYCIGVGIGAFLGAFLLPLYVAWRGGLRLKPAFAHPWLWRFLVLALPLMLGQTVVMLDEQFLRVFGSMLGEGNVSLLNYGRRIAQVPVSLMGQAAAVAAYPFLVKLLAENDYKRFDNTLNSALATALALIIPCALGMIAAARPIMGIIFEGGHFGPEQTASAVPLVRLMLAAAPVWIVYMVLARAFYAHEDSITPAVTGTIITIAVIPCYYFIGVPLGAWAIAAISGLSLIVYVVWLALIWAKRHGNAAFAGLGALCIKALACSLLPACAAWLACEITLPDILPPSGWIYCGQLAAGILAFILVAAPISRLFWPEMLKGLWKMLQRRLLPKGRQTS